MAIIENAKYNSLPEQVEENKDNIKRINEILENIDPEQVSTILSDIQALKAEQVVQNTAIGSNTQNIGNNTTAINNEKTAREDVVGVNVAGNTYLKTATPNKQILIYNNGHIGITSNNSNVQITAPSDYVEIATDNSSVKADDVNGVIVEVDSGGTPKTLTLKPNGDFEVSNGHILKFDTTGSITIDGQPIGGGGGGSQLYEHNVFLYQSGATDINITLTIITASSTPFTFNTLASFIYTNNGTPNDLRNCTGFFKASDDTTMRFANSCYATSSTELRFIGRSTNNAQITLNISSIAFLNDKVRTI